MEKLKNLIKEQSHPQFKEKLENKSVYDFISNIFILILIFYFEQLMRIPLSGTFL